MLDRTATVKPVTIYALQHIENKQYICVIHKGLNYLVAFPDGDKAYAFREALGLCEHVDIRSGPLVSFRFNSVWLDGEKITLSEATDV